MVAWEEFASNHMKIVHVLLIATAKAMKYVLLLENAFFLER